MNRTRNKLAFDPQSPVLAVIPGVSLLREPMREEILKQFFTQEVDAKVLADDLVGSMVTKGDMTKHPIEDMAESFQLGPEHLIRLCLVA